MLQRMLDERFLSVHPRTVAWWAEREQCRRCVHCVEVVIDAGQHQGASVSQRCARGSSPGPYRSRVLTDSAACIRMRDEGQPCGPEGALFEPKRS